jgi:hypothetical protein
MRRFLINLFALTPLLFVGFFAFPVLIDARRGPALQEHLVAFATHPYARPIFYGYMIAFFSIVFLPVIFEQLRQLIIRLLLSRAPEQASVNATILRIQNSGVRAQSGFAVHLLVRLPDNKTLSLFTSTSHVRPLAVGQTVRVRYDPRHPKRALLAEE